MEYPMPNSHHHEALPRPQHRAQRRIGYTAEYQTFAYGLEHNQEQSQHDPGRKILANRRRS
jgi:hypothetical protein